MNKFLLITLCCLVLLINGLRINAGDENKERKILVSAFPVWLIVRNITEGARNVSVELLVPAALGCPHDYTLSASDARKLTQADIVIVNGGGLDSFVEHATANLSKTASLIVAAKDLLEEDAGGHEEVNKHNSNEESDSHIEGLNPHWSVSPHKNIELARSIFQQLSIIDPDNQDIYQSNYERYKADVQKLIVEMAAVINKLPDKRIITMHDAFEHFAADFGFEVAAVVETHPGQEPSAAQLRKILDIIKTKQIKAVFAEPQYPAKAAELLAREGKIKFAVLDPVVSGEENVSLDYFQIKMLENIQVLNDNLR